MGSCISEKHPLNKSDGAIETVVRSRMEFIRVKGDQDVR